MKVAFLDRDGTIIKDYRDEEWRFVSEPEFFDNSIEALSKIQMMGYKIIIVTNQYLINEKIITQDQYNDFTDKFLSETQKHNIEILDIFYCPHSRNEKCECIKPNPGLINQAMQKYPNINLSKSFMVGDSIVDLELAKYFKLKFYGINIKEDDKCISVESLYNVLDFINE